ncbi:hypothetical protein JCM10908_003215 [Rhodotorula pacifica]|uniref:uncharacterized protein n=1 Tax=Rhodotorula pacifica TaxID=1495444 RepID=UPI00317D1A6F
MLRYANPPPPPSSRAARPPRVDRVKTCPSLLRVFVKAGAHHADTEFSTTHLPTRDERQVYTWRDSTLREILNLVRDADPALRASTQPLARFSVRIVYWDANADRYTSQEIAVIQNRDLLQSPPSGGPARQGSNLSSSNPRLDRTLADAKLVVGDFLDIAYIAPEVNLAPNQTIAQPAAGPSSVLPGRAGPSAAPGHGANGHVFGRKDDSTWGAGAGGRVQGAGHARVPPPRSGPNQWGSTSQRGPYGAPPPRHGPPQDQGWGARRAPPVPAVGGRSFESRDRPPPPSRRQMSRSPSPARNGRNGYDRPPHRRTPSPSRRSASPPPRRVDDADDVMRD